MGSGTTLSLRGGQTGDAIIQAQALTCDHGRGDKDKNDWRHHGEKIQEAGEIWLAAIGPDTKKLGEVKTNGQLYQEQYAATIAKLLGLTFTAEHPVAKPIEALYTK